MIVTVLVTKGIDALIRYRKAEGAMETATKDDLRARIMHLESVVSSLQTENATLQRQLGRMEAHIELLQGRCDAASFPQSEINPKT
jgi:predicted RNase H-like nuclease (RuvC/YqgF family)